MEGHTIPPENFLDPQLVASALAAPPFVSIDGIYNVRDFGANYLAPASQDARVKPLHLFRSAEPSRITPRGIEQLRAFGVRKIFDLRRDVEVAKYKPNTAMDGIEVVRVPILEGAMDAEAVAARLKDFAADMEEAFFKMNSHIVKSCGPALESVLVHLRDNPEVPCLLHCTAGKDRAGMLAGMVLMVLGVREEDIVKDYSLTEYGLQPFFPVLASRLQQLSPAYRENWEGTLALGASKPEFMQAVLKMVRDEYGSAEGFVLQHTSLGEADIARVRENMLVSCS